MLQGHCHTLHLQVSECNSFLKQTISFKIRIQTFVKTLQDGCRLTNRVFSFSWKAAAGFLSGATMEKSKIVKTHLPIIYTRVGWLWFSCTRDCLCPESSYSTLILGRFLWINIRMNFGIKKTEIEFIAWGRTF